MGFFPRRGFHGLLAGSRLLPLPRLPVSLPAGAGFGRIGRRAGKTLRSQTACHRGWPATRTRVRPAARGSPQGGPPASGVAVHPQIASHVTQIDPLLAQLQTRTFIQFPPVFLRRGACDRARRAPHGHVGVLASAASFPGPARAAAPLVFPGAPGLLRGSFTSPQARDSDAPLGARCSSLEPWLPPPRGVWLTLSPPPPRPLSVPAGDFSLGFGVPPGM